MRLEVPDHHVDTLREERTPFFEHLVGLANAGRVAQENFEFAALGGLHLLIREKPHVKALSLPNKFIKG